MGYNNTNSGSGIFTRFFSFFGFVCALVMGIGLLNKAGVNISIGDTPITGIERGAIMSKFTSDAEVRPEIEENITLNSAQEDEFVEKGYSMPKGYNSSNKKTNKVKTSAPSSSFSVDGWIDRFAGTAIDQAISKGVPAGVALAVGIDRINDGARINTWSDFMKEVIEPLSNIKEGASGNQRKYFKYSANSKLWAEGLGKTGNFSSNSLNRTMNKYDLTVFDLEVRAKLTSAPFVNEEVERKADMVAEEVVSKRRKAKYEAAVRTPKINVEPEVKNTKEEWADSYDEIVGREVAKAIVKKKMKSKKYISEEDMAQLIEQTNVETSKVMENNLAFPGRKINKKHPKAGDYLDITDPKNSQAREELYQEKLKEKRSSKG